MKLITEMSTGDSICVSMSEDELALIRAILVKFDEVDEKIRWLFVQLLADLNHVSGLWKALQENNEKVSHLRIADLLADEFGKDVH